MKTLNALLLFIAIFFCNFSSYGQKYGHVNYKQLIDTLSESHVIEAQLSKYEKSLIDVGEQMVKAFQDNYKKYQEAIQGGNLTPIQRSQQESDLQTQQTAIGNYQNSAKESMQKRNTELLKPFLTKIDTTIKNYGKSEGFSMILDSSMGMIISPDNENLFAPLYLILNKK
ncbi:MAG: OmpH family outer membrane protein [Saprospiraceae bacterium]